VQQRCTESEIIDFDSAPASAKYYTQTPLRLQKLLTFWTPTLAQTPKWINYLNHLTRGVQQAARGLQPGKQSHLVWPLPTHWFCPITMHENPNPTVYVKKLNFSCVPARCLKLVNGPPTKNVAHPWSKLLAVSKRLYPVFALKRLKKRIKRICCSLQYMSVASQIKD